MILTIFIQHLTVYFVLYIFTYTVQKLGNIVFLKEVSYAHQAEKQCLMFIL